MRVVEGAGGESRSAHALPSTRQQWLAGLEMTLVAGCFAADLCGIVPSSSTPFLFCLAWLSLRLRGLRWRDLGFAPTSAVLQTLAVGTLAGLSMELFALLFTEPLIATLVGRDPDLSDFRPLVGSAGKTAAMIAIAWPLAAFGEEMVYRGYLLNRLADIGRSTRVSRALALAAVTILFGVAHEEGQGVAGLLQEAWNGLILGLLYLGTGRNLMLPIVAHGMSNTLAFALIYLGLYPGV